jgi:enterochelin esterase-like enzyme
MRKRVVILLAACALAAAAATTTSGAATTVETAFYSHAIEGALHFEVAVPPDYYRSKERYPVVYFLHGLPAGSTAYRGDAVWLERALVAAGKEAIVVAPQGARSGDTDPEYHDWGPGRNWETALAVELPNYVDAHFRTIASRSGRALVGLSAGGYGAAIVALHHLGTFSAVESWSGYFHPTDPSGWYSLDVGSAAANARASVHTAVPKLKSTFRAKPTLFAFYVGDQDGRFLAENKQLDRELKARGVPHTFAVYSGGHAQSLWNAHAEAWLSMAVSRLAPAHAQ